MNVSDVTRKALSGSSVLLGPSIMLMLLRLSGSKNEPRSIGELSFEIIRDRLLKIIFGKLFLEPLCLLGDAL